MNTGRTTSFFDCFLVGILMSKNNYDKIDVFLGSFLVVSDEKVRESIFFGFIMAVRLKNINFLDTIKAAESVEELEQARVGLLGKKGEVTRLLRSLGHMNDEERKLKSPV